MIRRAVRRRRVGARRCRAQPAAGRSRRSRSGSSRPAARSTASGASAATARQFDVLKLRTMVARRRAHRRGPGDQRGRRPDHARRRVPAAHVARRAPEPVNVLRGDMAIIGPRPTVPVQVAQYTERQRGRLADPARASPAGRRSTAAPRCRGRERIELDLWYIEHRSWRSTPRSWSGPFAWCSAARASTRARPAAGRGRRSGCARSPRDPARRVRDGRHRVQSGAARRQGQARPAGDGRRRAQAALGAVPDLLAGIDGTRAVCSPPPTYTRTRPSCATASPAATRRAASTPSASSASAPGTTSCRGPMTPKSRRRRRALPTYAGRCSCAAARPRSFALYTGNDRHRIRRSSRSSSTPVTSCARLRPLTAAGIRGPSPPPTRDDHLCADQDVARLVRAQGAGSA